MMMMAVSVFAMILLGIASLYSAGLMKEGAKDSRRVVAEQMMIYHAAAARFCAKTPTSCPGGPLAPTSVQSGMASFRSDAGSFGAMNRRMRSLVVVVPAGTDPAGAPGIPVSYVVTYLSDKTTPGMADQLGDLGADVRMGNIGDTGIWNGIFKASTGKVDVAGGLKYWRDDAGNLTPVQKPLPISPTGATIPDGSPVVVSRI